MIYQTLLAPTESCPNLNDIKRALLTYDKVLITHPDDRELIPPQSLFEAVFGENLMGFGFAEGSVRPLAKCSTFDNDFDSLLTSCSDAIQKGLIEIVHSYTPVAEGSLFIGNVPIGDYPLNPSAMLWLYRSMAEKNDFLVSAIRNDHKLLNSNPDYIESISVKQCIADFVINQSPELPLIKGDLKNEEMRLNLSLIARGRLASILKTIGYCSVKEVIPFFSNEYHHNVLQLIIENSAQLIDMISEDDPFWCKRNQALQLCHQEYLDEKVLDSISLNDVIKLRTHAWGEQAEARDSLMIQVSEIVKNQDNDKDINKAVTEKIHSYNIKAHELELERKALKLKIACDFGMVILQTAMSGTAVSQIAQGIAVPTTLMAGCYFSLEKIKEYGPVFEQLKFTENEFRKSSGFSLHNFYQPFKKHMKRQKVAITQ